MTVWVKLNGPAATKFNDQYSEMLKDNHVTNIDFPPGMFVEYLLDIREQAQGMKKIDVDLTKGGPDAITDNPGT